MCLKFRLTVLIILVLDLAARAQYPPAVQTATVRLYRSRSTSTHATTLLPMTTDSGSVSSTTSAVGWAAVT